MRPFAKKVAVILALVLLWHVREIVVLVVIAGVLAAGIAPAMHRVRVLGRRWFGWRMRRGIAVLLVYLPFFLIAAAVLIAGVPFLIAESKQLMTELPRLLDERILTPLQKYVPVADLRDLVRLDFRGNGKPLLGLVRGIAGVVASVIAVLLLVFYMLLDSERLKNLFLLVYPSGERAQKNAIVLRMARRMSGWLSAQLILAVVIAGATFVALVALRIPYALPLAVLAGLCEVIPIIGPIAGAVPALVVALLQSPWQFWATLGAAFLIQQVENLVLVPRVMGNKVHVSPLGIFIAFMIGVSLLGIVGAILAAPLAAIIQVMFEEAFVTKRERRQDATRAGTLVTSEAREQEERDLARMERQVSDIDEPKES